MKSMAPVVIQATRSLPSVIRGVFAQLLFLTLRKKPSVNTRVRIVVELAFRRSKIIELQTATPVAPIRESLLATQSRPVSYLD